MSYINVSWPVLEAKLNLYKINKDASLLVKMQKDVSDINSRLENILRIISPYKKELLPLYSACDIDSPVFDVSSTAKLATYITLVSRVKTSYETICESWGV